MNYNTPYIMGSDSELDRKSNYGFDGQRFCRDNRNLGRRDLQLCRIGDIYVPWYYHKDDGRAGNHVPHDVHNVSLLFRITEEYISSEDVDELHQSYFTDVNNYSEIWRESLEHGQQCVVDCVKHYGDYPRRLEFFDGSTVDQVHIYEGHHRVATLKEIGYGVNIRTYHLYDMHEPMDIEMHYNMPFNNSFWDTQINRPPHFPWAHRNNPEQLDKFKMLMKCFEFINSLKIWLQRGIDIGCAEGAYTMLAMSNLMIPMRGIDSEPGRILRALMARMKFYKMVAGSSTFEVHNWNNPYDYHQFDFAMGLSITHHMTNPVKFFRHLAHIKCGLFEIRHSTDYHEIGIGSVKRFQPKDEALAMFARYGFKHELIGNLGDRHFYVIWRDPWKTP